MLRFIWDYHQQYCLLYYNTVNYVITLTTVSIGYYDNGKYDIYFFSNSNVVIYVVSNNEQYSLLLTVIVKGYDFKEAILSSFDSTDAIYQAGKDVVDVKRRLWRLMIFIFLSTTMLLFIYVVSNNYQYSLLLIVIIKGYDFKEAILRRLPRDYFVE